MTNIREDYEQNIHTNEFYRNTKNLNLPAKEHIRTIEVIF